MKNTEKNLVKKTLVMYWGFAWAYKPFVFSLAIFIPLAVLVFRYLPPLFVAKILERMTGEGLVKGDLYASFGPELILYGLTTFIGGIVLWRIVIYLVWQLEMRVLQDIHEKIFQHLVNQSSDFHANKFGGSLVSQANKFAGSWVRIADTIYYQLSGLVLSFIFTAIFLAGRAPLVVLALFVFSIIFIFLAIALTKKVRHLNATEAAMSTKQTGYLADSVTNIMAVKSFASESRELDRYHQATSNTRNATYKLMWSSLKRDTLFSSFTTGLGFSSLLLAAISVVYFDADIATVFLVVSYTGLVVQNLWDFSQTTLRNINRGLGDAREMTEILLNNPSIKDADKPDGFHVVRGSIIFDKVKFSHNDTKDSTMLFNDLSIHIKPGQKIGLVGHSGSGKTTLTKLLLRFVDIQSGRILIDDQDIKLIEQAQLRKHISYVPQEPLLFHRSIRENIAYSNPNASDREISIAAKYAHAHEFVEKLPLGYETLVGERGVKLSGGQRQRIAIARAMLKNAPILLLDEATSALDSESERLIQDALWKLMENKTAIVIAHRLSTIQKMDRIVVMEDGRIAEQGSHKELVRHNGIYASLWSHQSGGFLDE